MFTGARQKNWPTLASTLMSNYKGYTMNDSNYNDYEKLTHEVYRLYADSIHLLPNTTAKVEGLTVPPRVANMRYGERKIDKPKTRKFVVQTYANAGDEFISLLDRLSSAKDDETPLVLQWDELELE